MLKEDYVSFETAELLKEKGFDWKCEYCYDVANDNPYSNANYQVSYPKPTLQMAMKWLREMYNISIEPLVDFGNGNEYWWAVDVAYIKKNGLIDELCGYKTYEEACEAAIKYCLENLI